MYIIIGILAGLIILQSIILWEYRRQVDSICRQLVFIMKHESNRMITCKLGTKAFQKLSVQLNDLLEREKKEKQSYLEKETIRQNKAVLLVIFVEK